MTRGSRDWSREFVMPVAARIARGWYRIRGKAAEQPCAHEQVRSKRRISVNAAAFSAGHRLKGTIEGAHAREGGNALSGGDC